jgi:Raf kinase inhibitor-like YbhB/YbcL family protein
MIITSPSFENGGAIPKKFTCDGGDINPEFQIQNVPPEAKSLVLILHDPDAPMPGGFTHWVVWNIDPATTLIKQESIPPGGTEGRNGAGKNGYIGPRPPSGTHHYHFELYALDVILDLPSETNADHLRTKMAGHVIENAELIGIYAR